MCKIQLKEEYNNYNNIKVISNKHGSKCISNNKSCKNKSKTKI